jgi:transcriptional regulator with XRE-family HTH domain
MSVNVYPERADLDQAIRELLKSAKVSQAEAARRTGIPLSTLSRRLTGRGRAFLIHELAALRPVLGCSVTDMALHAERLARQRLGLDQ